MSIRKFIRAREKGKPDQYFVNLAAANRYYLGKDTSTLRHARHKARQENPNTDTFTWKGREFKTIVPLK
jgi:hypothetical protein